MTRCAHTRRPACVRRPERGAALVEFALVSLVLYLLLAGTVEFGRLMFAANALQDVARVAARELAVTPLPAPMTLDDLPGQPGTGAMSSAPVRSRIYDPSLLVVDITGWDDVTISTYFSGSGMPLVNKALLPLMFVDFDSVPGSKLLRYPGALLSDPNSATGFTVEIPVIDYSGGGETVVRFARVLEEIRPDPNDSSTGPFRLTNVGGGLAAVRINYPYQAAMLSGFRSAPPTATDPLPPNLSNAIEANDGGDATTVGTYAGESGLGRQFALAGKTVRPFRKLVSAQAIYRREVFQ